MAVNGSDYDYPRAIAENTTQLKGSILDANGAAVSTAQGVWTSSNTKVATVDKNGKVTAVGAGTATIKYAVDGNSKYSASMKVTVVVPVSDVRVYANNNNTWSQQNMAGENEIALTYGKSVALKANTTSLYGKPGSTKVKWSYEVYDFGEFSTQWNKYITLSSSGTLKISASIDNDLDFYDQLDIRVRATATDGSGAYGEYFVHVVDPVTKLTSMEGSSITMTKGRSVYADVYIDSKYNYYGSGNSNADYYQNFSVTSSNPDVVTVKEYATYGNILEAVLAANKAGTATITFKALDGTGKSTTIKVKVY